jgi:hypothetical protein
VYIYIQNKMAKRKSNATRSRKTNNKKRTTRYKKSIKQRGGNQSDIDNLGPSHYIKLNSMQNIPPLVSSRLLIGGKKSRKNKKMNGGAYGEQLSNGPVAGFGGFMSYNTTNLLQGTPYVNTLITSQPAGMSSRTNSTIV